MIIHCPINRIPAAVALILLVGLSQFLGGGLVAVAETQAPVPDRKLSAVAQLVFRGTSTLHDFEGRVTSQPFILLLSSNSWSAQAEVMGGEMTTSHERRDRNMWTMLSTNSHPRLTGAVRQAARPSPAGMNITLSLRIRDEQHDLPVTVTDWSETSDAVRFHAAWDVSLKQYHLKPPSVLGVIRVGDTVHIEAQVTTINPASPLVPGNPHAAVNPTP